MRYFQIFSAFFFLYSYTALPSLYAQGNSGGVPRFIFGNIQTADFKVSSSVVDPDAEVVVLADVDTLELVNWHGDVVLSRVKKQTEQIVLKKAK
jgi:hypothetical protein